MDCEEVIEKLDAHLLGALDSDDSEHIEEHLKVCASCRGYLSEAIQAMDTLRALPGIKLEKGLAEQILTTRRSKKYYLSLAVAMLLMLMLSLCLMWSVSQYRQLYPRYHLSMLKAGISKYRIDQQAFPSQGDLAESLLTDRAGGPYLSKKIFKTERGYILDQWGTPYVYRCPGKHDKNDFDLHSCGPNKKDEEGKGDDISNWK